MESRHAGYLLILASLYALFITSSAHAEYPVCFPVPGEYDNVYVWDGNVDVPAQCDTFCCAHVSGTPSLTTIKATRVGVGTPVEYPLVVETHTVDGKTVTRTMLFLNGEYHVTHAADGPVTLRVVEEIPKSVDYRDVGTSGVFWNIDPVLVLYLRAEKGETGVVSYSVKTDDYPSWSPRYEFASCELSIVLASLSADPLARTISGAFRIMDGERSVYLPSARVRVGDKTVVPQYSEDGVYSFSVAVDKPGTYDVEITARADGCPLRDVKRNMDVPDVLLLGGVLVLLVILLVFAFKLRK